MRSTKDEGGIFFRTTRENIRDERKPVSSCEILKTLTLYLSLLTRHLEQLISCMLTLLVFVTISRKKTLVLALVFMPALLMLMLLLIRILRSKVVGDKEVLSDLEFDLDVLEEIQRGFESLLKRL